MANSSGVRALDNGGNRITDPAQCFDEELSTEWSTAPAGVLVTLLLPSTKGDVSVETVLGPRSSH